MDNSLSHGSLPIPDTRKNLHRILEALPDRQIIMVKAFMESLLKDVDPVLLTLLTAPIDKEPLTQEEIEASERGWKEHLAGKSIPLSQAMNHYENGAGR